jgi:hypothetical protein
VKIVTWLEKKRAERESESLVGMTSDPTAPQSTLPSHRERSQPLQRGSPEGFGLGNSSGRWPDESVRQRSVGSLLERQTEPHHGDGFAFPIETDCVEAISDSAV